MIRYVGRATVAPAFGVSNRPFRDGNGDFDWHQIFSTGQFIVIFTVIKKVIPKHRPNAWHSTVL